jgi:hypothetical protein
MKIARAAVLIALLLTAMTVALLLLVDSPVACPGWHAAGGDRASLLGGLVLWTVPILALHGFIAVRWHWCLRKMAEKDSAVLVPNEYILTRMCLMGAAASQFPLLLVVRCLDVL